MLIKSFQETVIDFTKFRFVYLRISSVINERTKSLSLYDKTLGTGIETFGSLPISISPKISHTTVLNPYAIGN